MLAFLRGWELAVAFLFLERVGKAIRKPAHDAVVSFAAKKTGSGFGFGLHEAMDQIGAFLGPALFSALLFLGPDANSLAGYRTGLLLLFIPAALAVGFTLVNRFLFPHPERFELKKESIEIEANGYSRSYWIIVLAAGLLAMGITDFPLIGLHLKKMGSFSEEAIPLLYAGAMAVDAAAAIVFGRLYDKVGLKALAGLFLAEVFTAPLVFLGAGVVIGVLLRKRPKALKVAGKATTYAVWLLLLVMGIAVGSNPKVVGQFHELALQAGGISLASIAGSILVTALLCGWIFKDHGK